MRRTHPLKTKTFFNVRAERWDELSKHPVERVRYVLDAIDPRPGQRVLDVGSGTGVLIPHLLERVGPQGRVIALDFAENMIEVSRRKHGAANLEFVAGDFLAYQAPPFDLVVAYCCYPHFQDAAAFFAKARGLLKPGGRFGLAHIEGRASLNSMHAGLDGPFSRPLPPIEETARLAAAAGFEPLFQRDDREYYLLAARAG